MKIEDYKDIIKKTAVYPNSVDNFGLAYSWLGLIEESSEARGVFELFINDKRPALRKAVVKEIGDVCWYITNISVILGLDELKVFKPLLSGDVDYKTYFDIKSIELYAGNIKKYYRDGKIINKEEVTKVLNKHINIILKSSELYKIKLPEILKVNYDKLIKRRETNTIHGDGDNREENK